MATPLVAGAAVVAARLELFYYLCSPNCPEMTVTVHRLTSDWSESSATWANMGGASDPTVVATTYIAGGYGNINAWISWDVTDLAQRWISGELANYGLALHGAEEGAQNYKYFHSKEKAGREPRLIVDWTMPGQSEIVAGLW